MNSPGRSSLENYKYVFGYWKDANNDIYCLVDTQTSSTASPDTPGPNLAKVNVSADLMT